MIGCEVLIIFSAIHDSITGPDKIGGNSRTYNQFYLSLVSYSCTTNNTYAMGFACNSSVLSLIIKQSC